MKMNPFPFQTLNRSSIPKEEHKGETGEAFWQTQMLNDIRVRMVEYRPGYKADHWCSKGHIIFCIEGDIETELDDGRIMKLSKGMTYFVGGNCEAHRTSSKKGCRLFIVD
ncbi:MAG TPA: DHCW motif cupin fold protein [Chitinophagaceae bacterium]|nr:DHCW motif cupin fold protein [Chitinophagaceae bacterium]